MAGGASFGSRVLRAVLVPGLRASPALNTPKGLGCGLQLAGLPRCHGNCSIPAWQGWEISSIPSRLARPCLWIWHRQHPKPTEEHEVQFLLPPRAGPRSSFLHSPPRATRLPGQGQETFLLFRCGSSHSKPFHLLWVCRVLASRASIPQLPQIWGQQSQGCL